MKVNRNGLIGTTFIHGLILALLILGGLTFPDPPPEEEGVLVNFGTDDMGFGAIEPEGDEANQGEPLPEQSESYTPPVSAPQPTVVESTPIDNTQDVEEVKVKEDPKPTAEELRQQREEAERIQKEQEAERQRLAELERIRKEEEAERKRIEEERLRKEQQANRLNKLGQNTFGNQGVGDQSSSQGVTSGSGNQGTTTGSPGASNYGDGSGLGDGPTYGLGSRKAVGSLPLPNVANCNVTSRIVVTVEIQVDRSGNVTSAVVKSATFADNCIWNTVVQAAKKTKFSTDQNAPFKQTGWIKYTIEP